MAGKLPPSAKAWTKFNQDLVADLKAQIGDDNADRVLPAFNDAAEAIAEEILEYRGSRAAADVRRRGAKRRAATAKRIRSLSNRLLKELDAAGSEIQDAVASSELPRGYAPHAPTSLAQLGSSRWMESRQPMSHLQATLADLAHDAGQWEKVARDMSKGKPGRTSAHDRGFVAKWVGSKLADLGIPLIKSPDGKFAMTLDLLYDAAGIPKPVDLYRDVAAALDDPAGYWRGGDTYTALPRPQRKKLHKPSRRR